MEEMEDEEGEEQSPIDVESKKLLKKLEKLEEKEYEQEKFEQDKDKYWWEKPKWWLKSGKPEPKTFKYFRRVQCGNQIKLLPATELSTAERKLKWACIQKQRRKKTKFEYLIRGALLRLEDQSKRFGQPTTCEGVARTRLTGHELDLNDVPSAEKAEQVSRQILFLRRCRSNVVKRRLAMESDVQNLKRQDEKITEDLDAKALQVTRQKYLVETRNERNKQRENKIKSQIIVTRRAIDQTRLEIAKASQVYERQCLNYAKTLNHLDAEAKRNRCLKEQTRQKLEIIVNFDEDMEEEEAKVIEKTLNVKENRFINQQILEALKPSFQKIKRVESKPTHKRRVRFPAKPEVCPCDRQGKSFPRRSKSKMSTTPSCNLFVSNETPLRDKRGRIAFVETKSKKHSKQRDHHKQHSKSPNRTRSHASQHRKRSVGKDDNAIVSTVTVVGKDFRRVFKTGKVKIKAEKVNMFALLAEVRDMNEKVKELEQIKKQKDLKEKQELQNWRADHFRARVLDPIQNMLDERGEKFKKRYNRRRIVLEQKLATLRHILQADRKEKEYLQTVYPLAEDALARLLNLLQSRQENKKTLERLQVSEHLHTQRLAELAIHRHLAGNLDSTTPDPERESKVLASTNPTIPFLEPRLPYLEPRTQAGATSGLVNWHNVPLVIQILDETLLSWLIAARNSQPTNSL